jgi:hypothetical protein
MLREAEFGMCVQVAPDGDDVLEDVSGTRRENG